MQNNPETDSRGKWDTQTCWTLPWSLRAHTLPITEVVETEKDRDTDVLPKPNTH